MDFLKEFGKQFSGRGKPSSDKSKEGAELNRINAALSEAEAALDQLYARYGRACYAVQAGRGDPDAARALALRIEDAEREAEALAAARDAARAMKRCLGCGALFGGEARYCSACGRKLPEEPPKPEPLDPGEYCPACGAKREDGDVRCPVCGAGFDAPPASGPIPAASACEDLPAPEEPDGSME